MLHRERVIDDQLHGHHRIHLRRIAAHVGDRIAQAGEVDERGLAEDVVAHHAHREPREVEIALALDQLAQISVELRRIGLADEVLGFDARGVGELVVSARLDGVDGGARIEVIERRAGKGFAKGGVGHGLHFKLATTVNDAW